ncbi:hypothetical protein GL218_00096 [Daldinia childiae]|uniref:uncharacterized protein n=1 Tax=Daldinia childiae TaxID=326645 RepID=UPI001444E908|nr:uncharacterized protein GL218_00096 [Daldinia childiae]KAF3070595.1 hypothetical protein GL218_00096 [Daldinia childiae]
MPITLRTAPHPPRAWRRTDAAETPKELLKGSCPTDYSRCKLLVQSSIQIPDDAQVFPSSNGFVRAVYQAYSNHHHLKIRPEDVWFSIVAQLSMHINAHAEELRPFFVAHEGQKKLQVVERGTITTVDFGELAIRMTDEIKKNVVDPDLTAWIMPDFTTTTDTDRVTAAVLMMGALQKYFKYFLLLTCGIPSVTLLGEREDWVKIRRRLEYLPRMGKEPALFAKLLTAVLDYFIRSFDEPTSPAVQSFWSRIADRQGGSGVEYFSGWITAFTFWKVNGECMYTSPLVPFESYTPDTHGCNLDGTVFHIIDMADIPDAFASVPVTVNDNGVIHETRLVAGSIGMAVSSSGELVELESSYFMNGRTELSDKTGPDTLQPVSGWWMYELVEEGIE